MEMSEIISRRTALKSALALVGAVMWPTARACEFFATTLRVTHPWTRACAEGTTTAIVCMKIDQVTRTDRLIGVMTPLATGAELLRPDGSTSVNLLLRKGEDTVLGETGLRLRLTGLTQPLEIARTYPLRLVFEQGGELETELNVDYMPQA
jgi:copper(I)-binding protein